MFCLSLILFTLFVGILFVCFLSDVVNPVRITRICCNLSLIFTIFGFIQYDFSSYESIFDERFLVGSLPFYFLTSLNFIGIDSFSFFIDLANLFSFSRLRTFYIKR